MIRFLTHLFRLTLLIALAVWLADRPGTARIVWHDYIIETSAAILALGVVLAAYAAYLLLRLWQFLRHGPERWRLNRKLKKNQEGMDKLTQGFIALAGGDTAQAGTLALRARKALGVTPLTQLLQAQAASMAGDKHAARDIYRALTTTPESAALGYRGLLAQARHDNNWHEVAALAEKLNAVAPKTPLLHVVRFEIAARKQHWEEALAELNRAVAQGGIDQTQAKHHRAALFAAEAQSLGHKGAFDKSLSYAEQAMRLAPTWLPAIIGLAHSQMAAGHQRAALRTIEKHWSKNPHPQLADLYRGHSDSPLDQFKKMEKLCRDNVEHPVARLVLAEAALVANIWGEARRHLQALANSTHATGATYRLLASLERRENGDDLAAARWLVKAAAATPDPVLLCESCGGSHSHWQGTCNHCGSFNTLSWQSPGRSRLSSITDTQITAARLGFDEV